MGAAAVVLHDLVPQDQQEIDRHEDNQDIRPLPAIGISRALLAAILLISLLWCCVRDQHFVSLVIPRVVQPDPPVSTPVLRQIQRDNLSSPVKLVRSDPGILTASLVHLQSLVRLHDEGVGGFLFFVLGVAGVDVPLAQDHEHLQLLLELSGE